MFGFMKKASLSPAPVVKLYNTEARSVVDFVPLQPPHVTMYTCGPTVYDYAHIGNLRSYVFADILKRTLMRAGYRVEHTINLTDFGHLSDDGDSGEDKMMKGLKKAGKPITLSAMRELATIYVDAFQDDFYELRCLPPTTWSRASEYVKQQIRLIKTLEQKGYTYETSDGVYFDIAKFPEYGRLGNINLNELKSGARVEVNTEKRHPADFAVWKKGLLGWDSTWGKGFPGWHVECSAMAIDTLGKQIDIHTGGIDHVAIHHNAEIAQSEAATGKQFVQLWMHNEFITIDNTKIAKSLGNSITMRNLYDRGFTGDDYRYWLLTAHYRSPINFTFEALKAAKQALFRLKRFVYEEYRGNKGKPSQKYIEKAEAAFYNDLDTPKVIALLWDITKDTSLTPGEKLATILEIDEVLEIGLSDDPDEAVHALGVVSIEDLPEDIQAIVDEREAARLARNWEESDRLRELLNIKGYSVEDTPKGPKVSKA